MTLSTRTNNWTTEYRRFLTGGVIIDPTNQLFVGDPYRNGSGAYGVGWRDLVGQLREHRAAGAGVPVYTQIGSTGYWFHKFAVNDAMQVIYHVDHDFYYSSAIFFHAHWFKEGTAVQPVKWQFSIAYAHGHQQGVFDFTTPSVDTATQTPSATPYTHQIAEITNGMDLSYRTDGLVVMNIKRITNGGVDNSDAVYLMTADCHYQADKFATLNKSPAANGSFQEYP